jgi:hypothetical protein
MKKALLIIAISFLVLSPSCKKAAVADSTARVFIHSQGQIGSFTYVSGEQTEIKASDYSGVDADHIIVRRPNMGSRIGSTTSGGRLTVSLPEGGADVFFLRAGSRYSAVENGRLRYGRNPTWSWGSTSYTPTAEEISFIENGSNEFSTVLGSFPGINYGSLTKVSSGGSIIQKWGFLSGGPYASKLNNAIAYNAARMSPNTALGRSVVNEELMEMLIGLDDILGRDSRLDFCDAAGDLNQEGKDLLFYVFVKE